MKRAQGIALLAGAVCAPAVAGAQTPEALRLVSSPDDDATPALYADKGGLFKTAGITATIQRATNGAAVAAAVVGGSVDIGKSSILSLVLAHAKGVPLQIVAPCGTHVNGTGQTGILVLRDGPVKTAADLEGKTAAVPALNDLMSLGLQAWIDKHGGNSKKVAFVEVPAQSVGIALDSGRVAAAVPPNPAFQQDLATGKYRLLGDQIEGFGAKLMISAWFTTADYAAKNADLIRKFGDAMVRANSYANTHHDETTPLIAAFSGVEAATVKTMLRVNYATSLDPAMVQPFIDVAAKYGAISAAFDARELFSPYAYRK